MIKLTLEQYARLFNWLMRHQIALTSFASHLSPQGAYIQVSADDRPTLDKAMRAIGITLADDWLELFSSPLPPSPLTHNFS